MRVRQLFELHENLNKRAFDTILEFDIPSNSVLCFSQSEPKAHDSLGQTENVSEDGSYMCNIPTE